MYESIPNGQVEPLLAAQVVRDYLLPMFGDKRRAKDSVSSLTRNGKLFNN